jgi:hypothetical protein
MDELSYFAGVISAIIITTLINIIWTEIKAGMLKLPKPGAIVCFLGIHKWHYYYKIMEPFNFICRSCNRCNKIQHLNDFEDCDKWTDIDDNPDA